MSRNLLINTLSDRCASGHNGIHEIRQDDLQSVAVVAGFAVVEVLMVLEVAVVAVVEPIQIIRSEQRLFTDSSCGSASAKH